MQSQIDLINRITRLSWPVTTIEFMTNDVIWFEWGYRTYRVRQGRRDMVVEELDENGTWATTTHARWVHGLLLDYKRDDSGKLIPKPVVAAAFVKTEEA